MKKNQLNILDNQSLSNEVVAFWIKRKRVGRNQLCPCGSNKKFKKCCLKWIKKI